MPLLEAEGQPTSLHVAGTDKGSYLVCGTDRGVVKCFDISRREPKQHAPGKRLTDEPSRVRSVQVGATRRTRPHAAHAAARGPKERQLRARGVFAGRPRARADAPPSLRAVPRGGQISSDGSHPVSYTHLTLPTKA